MLKYIKRKFENFEKAKYLGPGAPQQKNFWVCFWGCIDLSDDPCFDHGFHFEGFANFGASPALAVKFL